jgi:hypothetical protein
MSDDFAQMLTLILVAFWAMVLIVVLGEVLVPGAWSCFPSYCEPVR